MSEQTTSIFDLDEFEPLRARWDARQRVLRQRESYYDGSVYDDALGALGWLGPRLGGAIRPLYLPCARAVNIDSGIVPGFWTLRPSSPLRSAQDSTPASTQRSASTQDAALQRAMDQVFAWSVWPIDGVLYVHYGALFGVSGLRVADLRAEGRIVIKPIDPRCFMLLPRGTYDSTPAAALWVERLARGRRTADGGPPGDTFEYAEVVEPERVRTFADGRPYGFDGRPPEYGNDLGFVPFVEVKHVNNGGPLGACAFQDAIAMLDAVNELATDLASIIKKHAEPQWAVIGADDSELERGGDNVWTIPAGGDVKVLVPGVDIAGIVEFLKQLRDHVEASMPELAFDDLKQKQNIATATVELQLMELVLLIKRVRPNYDAGLAAALRMAGKAAAQMGMPELAVLDSDDLRFDEARPVLPLDAKSALELEQLRLQVEALKADGGRLTADGG